MSKQWQATTRGGYQYRITGRDPDSDYPILGEVVDSGFMVRVQWTEGGRAHNDPIIEHDYDLLPIEPEAPSSANAKVDLALAAMVYKLASDAEQAAMERLSDADERLREAMRACDKENALVSIHGELFLFHIDEDGCIFTEQTEVL
jgi:hypothetical protein